MTFDLGIAPEGVELALPASRPHSIAGQRLLLRLEDDRACLKAGELQLEFGSWRQLELRAVSLSPARGGGYSEISLFDAAPKRFDVRLLDGRWNNLEWMREAAQSIAQALNIAWEDLYLGGDT